MRPHATLSTRALLPPLCRARRPRRVDVVTPVPSTVFADVSRNAGSRRSDCGRPLGAAKRVRREDDRDTNRNRRGGTLTARQKPTAGSARGVGLLTLFGDGPRRVLFERKLVAEVERRSCAWQTHRQLGRACSLSPPSRFRAGARWL